MILAFLACNDAAVSLEGDPPGAGTGAADCAEGFERADDGNCYPVPADTGGSPVDTTDTGTDTGEPPVDTGTDTDTGEPVDTADTGTDTGEPVDTADTGEPVDTGADDGIPDCSDPYPADASNPYGVGFFTWSSSMYVPWGGSEDAYLTGCLGQLAVSCAYGYVEGSFSADVLAYGDSLVFTLATVASGSGDAYDYCTITGYGEVDGIVYGPYSVDVDVYVY